MQPTATADSFTSIRKVGKDAPSIGLARCCINGSLNWSITRRGWIQHQHSQCSPKTKNSSHPNSCLGAK